VFRRSFVALAVHAFACALWIDTPAEAQQCPPTVAEPGTQSAVISMDRGETLPPAR
jgi:hypothetical protein